MDPLTRLALAARGGDKCATERFVEAAYEPVWHLCAVAVDRQSADDLAQETFLRAIGAIQRFRGESSARTWILSIARHTCMDELRSRTRRRRRDASSAIASTGAGTVAIPDATEPVAIADLIASLPPERQLAFELTQLVGLSYEEAATICQCPVGTIRSRVARARADLVSLLASAEDDGGTICARHDQPGSTSRPDLHDGAGQGC